MSQLQVKVEELTPVLRRLEVDVPAQHVVAVTESVYARLGRQAKIPGYRQGHVPKRILDRHYGRAIGEDVAREIVRTTIDRALTSARLVPVAEPTVHPSTLNAGEGFRYNARVEVAPTVTLGEYKGQTVTFVPQTVDSAAVDAQIERLREKQSVVVAVEDRSTVETGDLVEIDYTARFPNLNEPPQSRTGALIKVEPGLFIDGHGEKLAGTSVGETLEFSEAATSEEVPESLRGQPVEMTVTVRGIKRRDLPAVDDAFAQAQGKDIADVEALRAAVRTELEARSEAANRVARRTALLQHLLGPMDIAVPPSMLDQNTTVMAEQYLSQRGLMGPDARKALGEVFNDFKKQFAEQALFDLRASFLLDAVARAENLEPSPEEAQTVLVNLIQGGRIPQDRIQAVLKDQQQLAAVWHQARVEKAYQFVESVTTFVGEQTTSSDLSTAE